MVRKTLIFCGILSSLYYTAIPKELPTPFIGVWERLNIGAFMLWVIVFSFVLLKKQPVENQTTRKHIRKTVLNIENKSL